MRKIAALLVGGAVALTLASPALADHKESHTPGGGSGGGPDPKVLVCKYVGQPGVDETPQTGQNPIEVSANAVAASDGPGGIEVGDVVVGLEFADQQGRSVVVETGTESCETTTPDPDPEPEPEPDPDPTPNPEPTPGVKVTTFRIVTRMPLTTTGKFTAERGTTFVVTCSGSVFKVTFSNGLVVTAINDLDSRKGTHIRVRQDGEVAYFGNCAGELERRR